MVKIYVFVIIFPNWLMFSDFLNSLTLVFWLKYYVLVRKKIKQLGSQKL